VTTARDDVLRAIRAALASSPDAARYPPHLAAAADTPPGAAAAGGDPVELFAAALARAGGRCTVAASDADAAAALRDVCAAAGARRVAWSDAAALAPLRALCPALEPVDAADRDAMFTADVGVTTAHWAIAATGTLVLASGRERARLASLLPPVHVAMVPRARILPTMADALAAAARDGLDPALTFITGPSRTADIELTLVVGVHGPRELHVIVR
jgi:L-lactate dehydrogenase complex protein LldG